MTTEDLISFYKSLLILQYYGKTKASATVGAFCGELVADQVVTAVRDGFDLDVAIGDQLDILGGYRGVSRTIFGLNITKSFMAFPSYTDLAVNSYKGLALYSQLDAAITWFFFRYQDFLEVSYVMTDEEFRSVIQFKAAVDSSSLSVEEIDAILFAFFGNFATLTDNGDMTIKYNDSPSDPTNLFNLVHNAGVLPKPAGVSISVTTV